MKRPVLFLIAMLIFSAVCHAHTDDQASEVLRKQTALIFSLLISLFPALSLFRVMRKKLFFILVSIVIFAFNYLMIWLSFRQGKSLYAAIAIAVMAVLTGWAVWEYFHKSRNRQQ
ncbi:MAG: hypothetical protein II157_00525 [Bacteroidales bacterium]|nr:hypothetical protein [Bacteroidales bacterium]